jgi:RNA binding exosome subunit
MDITISRIEYSFSVHATEDLEKNLEALSNLLPEELIQETEIVVEELLGAYDNPIEYVTITFNKQKLFNKILDHLVGLISDEQKSLLFVEFDERFNQDKKSFHLRIDKQAILSEELSIISGTNIIKIEIKMRSYIKDVDFKQFLINLGLLIKN